METILITGSAGFIGYHVSKMLLAQGYEVVGYDNMNDYYDVSLKKARVRVLENYDAFTYYQEDICNDSFLEKVAEKHKIDRIIHLAAQAGVRYSLTCPEKYIQSNIIGTFHILELCRKFHISNLMYASSSSIYGNSKEKKLSLDTNTDSPISLYAATKKSNELLAHVYSNNYKINTVGMRFFTVYGPYGRPDMAYYHFTEKILKGETIEIFNYGKQYRDFTYIDDLLQGIYGIFHYQDKLQAGDGDYKIFNIGNGNPVKLMDFVKTLEKVIGKTAKKTLCECQTGDVKGTYADISNLQKICEYHPQTTLESGLLQFYSWYKEYKNNG